MAGPRRLRSLNFDALNAEPIGEGHENPEGNGNDESLQGSPDIDGLIAHMPHQTRSLIKIIWPNGEVRSIVGDFKVPNLLDLEGGKVMVGTDQNGVPNQRSASILRQHLGNLAQNSTLAPLHIQRWDNAQSKPHKEQIIKDVEVTRRVKAPIRNQTKVQVYIMSLEHRGRVLAKGEIVATAPNRSIGGTQLGPQFVGVYVLGLENIGTNKGDESLPRPIFEMRKIIDAVGNVIAWLKTHVIEAITSDAPKSVR